MYFSLISRQKSVVMKIVFLFVSQVNKIYIQEVLIESTQPGGFMFHENTCFFFLKFCYVTIKKFSSETTSETSSETTRLCSTCTTSIFYYIDRMRKHVEFTCLPVYFWVIWLNFRHFKQLNVLYRKMCSFKLTHNRVFLVIHVASYTYRQTAIISLFF